MGSTTSYILIVEALPFTLTDRRYDSGLCPVAERLQDHEILFFEPCAYALDDDILALLVAALNKVHRNAESLARHPS